MTDAEREALIEKMAIAIAEATGGPWDIYTKDGKNAARHEAAAALSIAEPIIRYEVLEEAAGVADGMFSGTSNLGTSQKVELSGEGEIWHFGSIYDDGRMDAASAIRSLKSKGQKP